MDKSEKFWNLFFSIIFVIALILALPNFPITELKQIEIIEIFLLILATQRLIRLFVYDKIMTFFRELFPKDVNSFLTCIHSLISCPWCFGVWATFIVLVIYYLMPYGKPIILLLAISTLASTFQITTNFIGWSAEKKKLECQKIEKFETFHKRK